MSENREVFLLPYLEYIDSGEGMRKYCKAYKLGDLRQFSGWSEQREEDEPELTDESICYLMNRTERGSFGFNE